MNTPWMIRAYAQEEPIAIHYDEVQIKWLPEDLNARLSIYQAYWKKSGWLGIPDRDSNFTTPGGSHIWHAQNLWVQWTYTFGYPVGILSFVITVLVLINAVRNAIKKLLRIVFLRCWLCLYLCFLG